MTVQALDHVNIITSDLDGTCAWYADLFELERRNAPPPLRPDHAQWMFDRDNRAIFHINSLECPRFYDRDVTPGPTGSIHHVALRCEGFERMVARLSERGLHHEINRLDSVGLRQIFTLDPNGVLLELNFFGD